MTYASMSQREIILNKYLTGRKNVNRRWKFYLTFILGITVSLYAHASLRARYEVQDPAEGFILYSMVTKIPRYFSKKK